MPKLIGRLLVVLALGWAGSANAGLILNITGGGTEATCGFSCSPAGSTFGWAFAVNTAITVDGLGIWDADADGIGPNVLAGLWMDGGALLASAEISSSSALQFPTSAGGWRFEDIAVLNLTPGNYVLGFTAFPSTPAGLVDPFFSTIPQVTYTGPRDGLFSGVGLVRPDSSTFPIQVFGPNLRVVPTPATAYLLGLSLAVLGYSRRRYTQHI